jgi:hypothetical protein
MENTLGVIAGISFVLFWVMVVIFYTPSCFNLKTMIDSINYDGKLTKTKAPLSMYLKNMNTLECWIIPLPKADKYLKHEILRKAINHIRIYRIVISFLLIVVIISSIILYLNTKIK